MIDSFYHVVYVIHIHARDGIEYYTDIYKIIIYKPMLHCKKIMINTQQINWTWIPMINVWLPHAALVYLDSEWITLFYLRNPALLYIIHQHIIFVFNQNYLTCNFIKNIPSDDNEIYI